MKPADFIVYCADYNGHSTFFRMKEDDFRFGTSAYRSIGRITKIEKDRAPVNGRSTSIATTVNGQKYRVFSDWSAKIIA